MRLLLAAATATALLGQAAATRPSFEVVSIKSSNELDPGGDLRWTPGGTVRIRNFPARGLLMSAYGNPRRPLLPSQLIGAPDWVSTERYVITAKVGADLAARPQTDWFANLPGLLQSLLEER